MSIIVFILCLGVVASSKVHEPEYHTGYYKDTGYTSLSKYQADSYTYESTSYYHGKYKKSCSTYSEYTKGRCYYGNRYSSGSYGYSSGSYGNCKPSSCDATIYYGYNKCNRRVKLHKPYYCPGYECYSNSYCNRRRFNQSGYSYSSSNYGNGGSSHDTGYRVGGSEHYQHCTCQTVWCVKTIWAAVQGYGTNYGGYGKEQVRINYPCRCECRQKY